MLQPLIFNKPASLLQAVVRHQTKFSELIAKISVDHLQNSRALLRRLTGKGQAEIKQPESQPADKGTHPAC